MPKEYLDCVKSEMARGKPKKEAQKICAIRYYNLHGITPQEAERRGKKDTVASMNKFNYAFDITKINDNQNIIEGYASVVSVDRDNEIIMKEALEKAFDEYMRNPVIRYMHQKIPIGKAIDGWVDNKGLFLRAKITTATKAGREAWSLIKEGILKAFSIGGNVKEYEIDKENGNIRIIKDMELLEVSVVDIPSNRETFFEVVAKSIDGGMMDINKEKVTAFEQKRKELGMSVSEFYAVPRDPPSASKLPIYDEAHVRNAMARFSQTKGLTEEEKKHAIRAIIRRAKKFGIDYSNFAEKHGVKVKTKGAEIINIEVDTMAEKDGNVDIKKDETVSQEVNETKEEQREREEQIENKDNKEAENNTGDTNESKNTEEKEGNENAEKSTEIDLIKALSEKVDKLEKALESNIKDTIIKAVSEEVEKILNERASEVPRVSKSIDENDLSKKDIGELALELFKM